MTLIVTATCIAIVTLLIAIAYNRFVTYRNRCRNAWSQVDIQLERRRSVIPELADIVRRYASHERDLLSRLSEARARAGNARSVSDASTAESSLGNELRHLFAVSEAYPELRAHRSFLRLQNELRDSEERIRFARQFYNDTVMRYNTILSVFPNVILAKMFRFDEEIYFEFD